MILSLKLFLIYRFSINKIHICASSTHIYGDCSRHQSLWPPTIFIVRQNLMLNTGLTAVTVYRRLPVLTMTAAISVAIWRMRTNQNASRFETRSVYNTTYLEALKAATGI